MARDAPTPPLSARLLPSSIVPNVARVELRGRIGREALPGPFTRRLDAALRLPNLAGILLRVESPGGEAVASDDMARAVAHAAERVPVVAAIRSVGASGGYMVAAAAHEIVAREWALVGSIGAILMRPNVTGLLERVGVSIDVTKTGPFKDLGSPFRLRTDADEAKELELLDAIGDRFVASIAEARGLKEAAVRKIATGEVFTAERARAAGLVDHVGDETKALERLGELAGTAVRPFPWSLPGEPILRGLRPAAMVGRLLGPAAGSGGRILFEWIP